ncbi:hypothetical protein ODJ79_14405 [Actinoplanes sp. KI2]|uniref:Rv0361 family membrane protein n=1 Tax=Actinoplanes sp. KI2 TaxID=2983315 RepID=UPI0021D5DC0A|nr:hypothetical protein [Actinoplanes sp. KI2]MCU7724915.1 hypothetical protein [Actinoplanes sp. KI2]
MSATPPYGPPPYGPPPYGPPPYGPPPKRPTRWILIIGLIVGGLVFLCCAGGAVFFGVSASQTKPATAAAESYVNAVIAGDEGKALQYVCGSSNAKSSHDSFTDFVHTNNITDSYVVNTRVTLWNLSWEATVQMKLTSSTGSQQDLELPLAKEDGEWKVCG